MQVLTILLGEDSPYVDAGGDISVLSGDPVETSAVVSVEATTFQWTQIAGPTVAFETSDAGTLRFDAPTTDVPMEVVFMVTADIGFGEIVEDSVVVTINPSYGVSAMIAGLAVGEAISLAIDGIEIPTSTNGVVVLGHLGDGDRYDITLAARSPSTICQLAGAQGFVDGADVVVHVSCAPAAELALGGTVQGLEDRDSITLSFARGDVVVDGSGTFQFAQPIYEQETYQVALSGESPFVSCELSNESGVSASADVLDVLVSCDSRVGSPQLVRDVNTFPTRNGIDSDVIFPFPGGALFDGGSDQELWITDGTQEGTRELLDIRPGEGHSTPKEFVLVGDTAYFIAQIASDEYRLWRTDGTTVGTAQVADVPLAWDSQLRVLGSLVIFRAIDPVAGLELHVFDATTDQVRLLVDIHTATSVPNDGRLYAANVGNLMVFSDRERGDDLLLEIWATDGTTAGTQQISDFATLTGGSRISIHGLTSYNGLVYFWVSEASDGGINALWRTDGTADGTEQVVDFASTGTGGGVLGLAGGDLYISAPEAGGGEELYRTDGTSMEIIDINDTGPSNPNLVLDTVNGVFVRAIGASGSQGLWLTQGTTESTESVFDNADGSLEEVLSTPFDSGVVYTRWEGSSTGTALDLWIARGTTPVLLLDAVQPSPLRSITGAFLRASQGVFSTQLFFMAETPETGNELWVTDGTAGGTREVANTVAETQTLNGLVKFLGERADGLYFQAFSEDGGDDLWRTDGTEAGTVLLDVVPGPVFDVTFSQLGNNSILFGEGRGSTSQTSVFRLDSLNSIPLVTGRLVNSYIDASVAFFSAYPDFGTPGGLYATDLATADTTPLAELAGVDTLLGGSRFTPFNDKLYFRATVDGTVGLYALASDYTLDLITEAPFVSSSYEAPLPALNGNLIWSGSIPGVMQLWRSDGTAGGTELLLDPVPSDFFFAGPSEPVVLGELAYFSNMTEEYGSEPWVTDGTVAGTRLLADLHPHNGSGAFPFEFGSSPSGFSEIDGIVYFFASNPEFSLYRTDGTEAGTAVAVPLSGLDLSHPSNLYEWNGLFYFTAMDSDDVERLYVTDGETEARLVNPDLTIRSWRSSLFRSTAGPQTSLYLNADDGLTGFELYKLH